MPPRSLMLLALALIGAGCGHHMDAAFSQALAAQLSGRQTEAIVAYRTLLAGDPDAQGAWRNLGAAYLMVDDPRQAIGVLEHALELHPEDLLGRYLLALAHLRAEHWRDAAV